MESLLGLALVIAFFSALALMIDLLIHQSAVDALHQDGCRYWDW